MGKAFDVVLALGLLGGIAVAGYFVLKAFGKFELLAPIQPAITGIEQALGIGEPTALIPGVSPATQITETRERMAEGIKPPTFEQVAVQTALTTPVFAGGGLILVPQLIGEALEALGIGQAPVTVPAPQPKIVLPTFQTIESKWAQTRYRHTAAQQYIQTVTGVSRLSAEQRMLLR